MSNPAMYTVAVTLSRSWSGFKSQVGLKKKKITKDAVSV